MSVSDTDLAYEAGREDGIAEATKAAQALDVERLAVAYHVAMHHGPHGRTNFDIAIAAAMARAYAGRDGE